MMKTAIAIALTIATIATADDRYCRVDGSNGLTKPQTIPAYYAGVNGYDKRPASVWYSDGWRPYMGVQDAPDGMTAIHPKALALIGNEVWTVPTFVDAVEYEADQAAQQAAAEQAAIQAMAADTLRILAPILADHPAPGTIPAGGMYYRITVGAVTELWYVRDADHISTQLSAHDANGNHIIKIRNLNTGIEDVIDMKAMKEAVEKMKIDVDKLKTK